MCVVQRHSQTRNNYGPYTEDSVETENLVRDGQTLNELLDDFAHSGSGSGRAVGFVVFNTLLGYPNKAGGWYRGCRIFILPHLRLC